MQHIILSLLITVPLLLTATHTMHAQSRDVSRHLGSEGAVLAFASVGRDTILASLSSGQLFRSCDMAWTWSLLSRTDARDALTCFLHTDAGLFAGTRSGAIVRSTDAGTSWLTVHRFPTEAIVSSLVRDGDAILGLSRDGSIARGSECGSQWNTLAVVPSTRSADVLRLNDTLIVACGDGDGLLISDDAGATWNAPINPPLSAMITDLERCGCGGVLASTKDEDLYHSSDVGITWQRCAPGVRPTHRSYDQIQLWEDSLVVMLGRLGLYFMHPHVGLTRGIDTDISPPCRSFQILADGSFVIGDSLGGIHRTLFPLILRDTTDYVTVDIGLPPVLNPGDRFAFKPALARRVDRIDRHVAGNLLMRNPFTGDETFHQFGENPAENAPLELFIPPDAQDGEYVVELRVTDSPYAKGIVTPLRFIVRYVPPAQRTRCVLEVDSISEFLAVHGSASGGIYCSAGRGVLLHSSNDGEEWNSILPPEYGSRLVRTMSGDLSKALCLILDYEMLLVSRKGGASWERILPGAREVRHVAVHEQMILVVADGQVLLSEDLGISWNDITPFIGVTYDDIRIGLDRKLYLCCSQGLWVSDDRGSTWRHIQTAYGRSYIPGLLVAMNGALLIPYGDAMYRTTDGGSSWSWHLDREFDTGRLRRLTETTQATLFAKLDGTLIMRSTDGGEHWENDPATADTLPRITGLCAAGDNVFIATSGAKLYLRPPDDTPSSVRAPAALRRCHIASLHPNPSRGIATVTLETLQRETVHLQVHDMLGRSLSVLHDAELPAGRHAFHFDTATLPAGTYLIVLRSASQVHTERLVLLR